MERSKLPHIPRLNRAVRHSSPLKSLGIGRYSQNAMSAISLCNQLQFLLQILVIGVGDGALLLLSTRP
ncbi:hypothetical protein RFF05_13390 [Bengtsoniella intestinalis]|uniref:hypothetical protein n=1 Tax=Bengtsoniella intestinalis TaxID=3073143 RepID=UPI00391F9BC4